MPNSLNFRSVLRLVTPRACRLSKTFPEVPKEFRVSRCKQESPNHSSGTRNIQGLAGNVGCSRAARCLRIIKFSCIIPKIPESEPEADSLWKDSLSVAWRVHRVSIVELYQLPHSKFFLILQLLGNLLRDLILQIASFFRFEPDQSIDSPDRAPFSGIQAVGQFHREQHQHLFFPILFCLFQPVLQIILSEPHIILDKLVQLPFQGIHDPVVLEILK